MPDKNRRLVIDGDIVYPITKQENVIGLQKTIKDKLPIVSSEAPENYVEKQVWIDTSEQIEEELVQPLFIANPNLQSNNEEIVSFQLEQPEEVISSTIQENDGTEISSQLEQQEEVISYQLEEEPPSSQIESNTDEIISTVLESNL